MGITHRRFDIFVAEKFLDGADVVAVLAQMRGEGMAEGVATDALGDVAGANGLVEGFLDSTGMEWVTIGKIMPIVFFKVDSGENTLPAPFSRFVGIFFGDGKWEGDLAIARSRSR
jgi:hypothetical protein